MFTSISEFYIFSAIRKATMKINKKNQMKLHYLHILDYSYIVERPTI